MGAKKVGKVLVMLLVNTTTERYVTQHGKAGFRQIRSCLVSPFSHGAIWSCFTGYTTACKDQFIMTTFFYAKPKLNGRKTHLNTGNHSKNKQPSSVSLQHRELESPALQYQLHSSINEQHSLGIIRMFTFTTDFSLWWSAFIISEKLWPKLHN